jgi:hypothetical protein
MDGKSEQGEKVQTQISSVEHGEAQTIIQADDAKLAELGYKSEFRREFSVSALPKSFACPHFSTKCKILETVAFAFSIMGVIASVTSTLSFGLVNGSNYLLFLPCFTYLQSVPVSR